MRRWQACFLSSGNSGRRAGRERSGDRRQVCQAKNGEKLPGGGVTGAKSLKDDEGEMGEVSKGRGAFQAEGGAQIDN